jgi:hypothetical protein
MFKPMKSYNFVLREWAIDHLDFDILSFNVNKKYLTKIQKTLIDAIQIYENYGYYSDIKNTMLDFSREQNWDLGKSSLVLLINPLNNNKNNKNINWQQLSCNPNAIYILEKLITKYHYKEKTVYENYFNIDFEYFSLNPALFIDEYEIEAKQYFKQNITEELMKTIWHPKNIDKFEGLGMDL